MCQLIHKKPTIFLILKTIKHLTATVLNDDEFMIKNIIVIIIPISDGIVSKFRCNKAYYERSKINKYYLQINEVLEFHIASDSETKQSQVKLLKLSRLID